MDQIYDDVNEIYNDILGESNEKLLENLPPKNLNSAILDYEDNGIIMKYILEEKLILYIVSPSKRKFHVISYSDIVYVLDEDVTYYPITELGESEKSKVNSGLKPKNKWSLAFAVSFFISSNYYLILMLQILLWS